MDDHYGQDSRPDDHPGSRSRGGLAGYLAVALVASIIGGAIGAAGGPFIASRLPLKAQKPPVNEPAHSAQLPGPVPISQGGNNLPTSQVTIVAEAVGPAVVGVVNKVLVRDALGRAVQEQGTGSGVIFDSSGLILTNNHVVANAAELVVSLADGRKIRAVLVGTDELSDLAVIKVEADNLKAAPFGDSDRVRVGDLAIAIGNPLGLDFERTVTVGIISGVNRLVQVSEESSLQLIQTDATINPGNSGGPLVNAAGEVVGINTIKFRDAGRGIEGMGFAIPINSVRAVIDDLVKHGRVVNRPFLGIYGATREEAAGYYGVNIPRGLLLVRVVDGSPATQAGLRVGDNLLSIDGRAINTRADLRGILLTKKPNDKITVQYLRGNRESTASIALTRAP